LRPLQSCTSSILDIKLIIKDDIYMKVISFQGEIGWDLWPSEVRDALSQANGDDLTIRFSSIGGDIFDGADIFNILVDHKSDNPGIKMNLELKGVAASMGSAIASAPVWSDVAVSPITGYMIHNPMTFAIGDYRDMESSAAFLKVATENYRNVYSKRSGKTADEIQRLMDAETWFFGSDIVAEGFADRVIESGEPAGEDNNRLIMRYKNEFRQMVKNQKQLKQDEGFDSKRAAACFRGVRMKNKTRMVVPDYKPGAKLIDVSWSASASETRWRDHVGVQSNEDLPNDNYSKRFAYFDGEDSENFGAYKFPHWDYNNQDGEFVNISAVRNGLARIGNSNVPEDDKPRVESLLRRYLDRFNEDGDNGMKAETQIYPGKPGKPKQEVSSMTLDELKKENPDVYSAVMKIGADEYKAGNDERLKKLAEMKASDEYKDIPEVVDVIEAAMVSGDSVQATEAKIVAVMMKVLRDPARMAALESPADISGGNGGDETPATHMEA
jgi:ATP-dependent Clp protease, protease subunit